MRSPAKGAAEGKIVVHSLIHIERSGKRSIAVHRRIRGLRPSEFGRLDEIKWHKCLAAFPIEVEWLNEPLPYPAEDELDLMLFTLIRATTPPRTPNYPNMKVMLTH
jgi:hypothetical protein